MICNSFRLIFLIGMVCLMVPYTWSIPNEDYETVQTSNAAILNRLGLVPVLEVPSEDGHHRKRLAGPSGGGGASLGRRHASSPHDSHVYIVKLPASAPYYSFVKPHKLLDPNLTSIAKPKPNFKNNGKPAKIYHWNLPLLKKINEKKKQKQQQFNIARMDQTKKMMANERERLKLLEKMSYFKKLAQEQLIAAASDNKPSKPTRNNDKWLSEPEKVEPRMKSSSINATHVKIPPSGFLNTGDKMYRLNDDTTLLINQHHQHHHKERESSRSASSSNEAQNTRNSLLMLSEAQQKPNKSHKKKSAISYYYAPALTGKATSNSISKHFPGNGKPKAFYVMEKSRKPIYYHPLLP